jgi:hypothetical protein
MQAQKTALEKFENCDGNKSQSLPRETPVFGVQTLVCSAESKNEFRTPALNLRCFPLPIGGKACIYEEIKYVSVTKNF